VSGSTAIVAESSKVVYGEIRFVLPVDVDKVVVVVENDDFRLVDDN